MAGIIDNELYSLYYIENNRSQIMSDHLGSASFLTDNNGKEKDLESSYNYYGARYYYDWLSIWLSVDPLSDKYPHVTSYNYCANNPVMLVDPDGREIGWYETEGKMLFDKDINSQQDLSDAGINGKYWGSSGTELNNEGRLNVFLTDGRQYEYPSTPLNAVDIDGGEMSEHARTMSNPIVQSIHKGQNDFIEGAVRIGNDILSGTASAITIVGYGATLVGCGAIGVPLIGAGETLGRISIGIDTGLKMYDGNYSGAAINVGTFGLGLSAQKMVKSLQINDIGADILKGGINIKTDGVNRGVNYINNKKNK